MDNATYVALSRASALERNLAITANNIANANTTAFKSEQAVFEAYVERQSKAEVRDSVSFVVDGGSFVDLAQGALTVTGGTLDLAIEGGGWFGYETARGQTVLGRDGALMINEDGALVTQSGAAILDDGGGAFRLPAGIDDLHVARDGTLSDSAGKVLGKVGLFQGGDIQNYTRLGDGMFAAPNGQQPNLDPVETPQIVQGALEGSNVNAVFEMTRLIELHRAYENSLKAVTNKSDLTGDAIRRLGQTG